MTSLARRTPQRRTVAALVAAGLAVLSLAGCSQDRLGAAAVVDGRPIATEELQRATRDYLDVVPGGDAGEAQLAILQRMIVSAVIDELAREVGVSVRDGRVAAQRDDVLRSVGGRRGLVRRLAKEQQTVLAPSDVDRWVKDRLLFNAVAAEFGGGDLDPAAPATQEALTRANDELRRTSAKMDIEVSPRYGSWDPEKGLSPLVSGGLSRTVAELAEGGPRSR